MTDKNPAIEKFEKYYEEYENVFEAIALDDDDDND